MEILSPLARPRRRVPTWALITLVVALFVDGTLGQAVGAFVGISMAAAVVAVVPLAVWAEERIYLALCGRRTAVQLGATFMLPLGAYVCGAIATAVTAKMFDGEATPFAFLIGGMWISSAAVGSLIVLLIDMVGQFAASRFAARIRLAVLGLAVVWGGLFAAITIGIPKALSYVFLHAPETMSIQTAANTKLTADQLRQKLAESDLPQFFKDSDPGELVGWGLAFAVLILLIPAMISAASKLGELAMERIHPLDLAMERVAAGDLAVRVEEGGSVELKRLAVRFNEMVGSLELSRRLELAFGAYVSRPVLDRIRAQHGALELPVIQRDATVFFADVRGFTAFSEALPPEQVLNLLRRYYARVLEVVGRYEGYVDKFIGDAIYVVFNGPIDQHDHAVRAVRCAIAIQELVERANREGAFPEVGKLEIGIGVASGPVIAGNLGTDRSTQFAVVGDTVNLAARFSGVAPAGEVWINEACAAALAGEILSETLAPITVKGKAKQVAVHRVYPRPHQAEPEPELVEDTAPSLPAAQELSET